MSETASQHVCPYCGTVTPVSADAHNSCPQCGMEDSAATRSATVARVGPWYVLGGKSPTLPGMNFETLKALVNMTGGAVDGTLNTSSGLVVMPFVCEECGYLELYVADKTQHEKK